MNGILRQCRRGAANQRRMMLSVPRPPCCLSFLNPAGVRPITVISPSSKSLSSVTRSMVFSRSQLPAPGPDSWTPASGRRCSTTVTARTAALGTPSSNETMPVDTGRVSARWSLIRYDTKFRVCSFMSSGAVDSSFRRSGGPLPRDHAEHHLQRASPQADPDADAGRMTSVSELHFLGLCEDAS